MNRLMFVLCFIAIGCGSEEVIELEVDSGSHKESINNVEDEEKELTLEEIRQLYTEITFENAHELRPGIYRFTPTEYYAEADDLGEEVIQELIWGNVGFLGNPVNKIDFPEDVPKIRVTIYLTPTPYKKSKLGVPVIEVDDDWVVLDEVLVRIFFTIERTEKEGGERGNKFKYLNVRHKGAAMRNLTNPDRIFESE